MVQISLLFMPTNLCGKVYSRLLTDVCKHTYPSIHKLDGCIGCNRCNRHWFIYEGAWNIQSQEHENDLDLLAS